MGKVRGRRSEKKEKEEKNDFEYGNKNENENGAAIIEETKNENNSTAFFGLVDSTELTYFHQAEQTLNLDTFQTEEEKNQFVSSVFQEAKGKELKLVTNQICSKLMERLILQSKLKNIHQLFNAFNGRFFELSRQKYSSHVLETFLVRCASLIEKEILSNGHIPEEDGEEEDDNDNEDDGQGYVSMENMFLFIIGEFKPHLKQMLKDKYASHVLRISLLVLTGKELPSSTESNSILRSKKSKIARKMIEIKDSKDYEKQFQVPVSFKEELKEILKVITNNETCESLRELSIEAVASPVIQLLIQLEGIVDRDRTIYNLIFNGGENKDSKTNDKERAFVEYLLSNNIGSHFLQKAIENQKAKSIERLYNNYMKDRIVKLAKRETTAVYIIESLMEKLKKNDQIDILNDLVPVLNELIVNNLEIGGKIVDCSIRNNNFLKDEIVKKFMEFFNKKLDEDANSSTNNILENVLKLSTSTLHSTKDDWPTSEERRRSLFLEKLIVYDGKILHECIENILNLDDTTLIKLCKHGVFSHIIECCIEQTEELTMVEKKRLLNVLVPHIVELSCNATGSHIVDKLWGLTFKLNMYKERIAKELFDNKDTVKITIYGKMVWKNWGMEMYCRKFNDWKRIIKNEEYEKKDREDEEKRKAADEEEESKKRALDDGDKTNKRRRGRK